jgi:hypothetical protein
MKSFMPQESFETWVGRSIAPIREFCNAFWLSTTNRVIRGLACTTFALAAGSGMVATYESLVNYPTTMYETEETRTQEAAVRGRVEIEVQITLYGTLASLAVMAGGVLISRPEES